MIRYLWFIGCCAVVTMAVMLGNACLKKTPDELYCVGHDDCGDGFVCDVDGQLSASGMHANTCVLESESCLEECVNPVPVCKRLTCQACEVNDDCPAEAPLCLSSGACVECLPDGTGCNGDMICNPQSVCVARCQGPDDCGDSEPICGSDGYCVECVLATDCTDNEICNDGRCEPCSEHDQCESGICDESGASATCVLVEDIVYVDNQALGAENTPGCGTGANKPCVSIAYAVSEAANQGKTWIHVGAGTYTGAVTITGGQSVKIVGKAGDTPEPAVVLNINAVANAVLTVQDGNTNVHVDGLLIDGGTLATFTVYCLSGQSLNMYRSRIAGGVNAGVSMSACALVGERVMVSGSSDNGVSLSNAPFTLRNSVIMENAGYGIRRINSAAEQLGILEFSTIVGNSTGLSCDVPLTSVSHIILGNGDGIAGVGGCFDPDAGGDNSLVEGRDAIDGLAADGYHLTETSPAVNTGATTPPEVTEDFDGEPRPNGTIDIGADEYYPGL